MTKRLWFIFTGLLFFMIWLSGCTSGDVEPFTEEQVVVRDLSVMEERLIQAVAGSELLSLEVLGEISYDGFSAPIWLISFTPPGEVKDEVFFSGGVHGTEPAGTEALVEMIEDLSGNPEEYSRFSFDIIPLVNPWGWVHDLRYNRDGRDVNRDLSSLRTQEASIVVDFLDGKEYDLMVDCHESRAGGFYLYQSGVRDSSAAREAIEEVRKLGYDIEQDVKEVIFEVDDGLIDSPMWALHFISLTGQLSAAPYYRLNHTELAYTTETFVGLEMKDRVIMQRLTLDVFLDNL